MELISKVIYFPSVPFRITHLPLLQYDLFWVEIKVGEWSLGPRLSSQHNNV